MASGDILSVRCNTGWTLEIDVSGSGGTGSYNTGFSNYHDTAFTASSPTVTLYVTSSGYDDSGNSIYVSRTIYGTKFLRQAYPSQSLAWETQTGSNVTTRIILSNYVYQSDVSASVNISAGLYASSSVTSSATSSFTVTNNSTCSHQKVIANWSWVPFTQITSSTFTLRCVAFHNSAQSGRPVRAVKFTATDNSGNTTSTIVNNATIDSSIPDQVKVIEYVGTLSSTSLTQGQIVTCSFIAYPWIGDSSSTLNTNDGIYQWPTPLYCNLYILNNKNNTYGTTIVSVDPVSGNDSTGKPMDSASWSTASYTSSYLSIAGAFTGIKTYNNNSHSRNDCGAGIVYLLSGSYNWMGGTVSAGNLPACWTTVQPFPSSSVSQSNVVINGQGGSTSYNNCKIAFNNITFTSTATTFIANYTSSHWFNNCMISCSSGASIMYYTGPWYLTNNTIPCFGTQGIMFYGDGKAAPALIRGNNLSGFVRSIQVFTMLGNLLSHSGSTVGYGLVPFNAGYPAYCQWILAYNKCYHLLSYGTDFLGDVSIQNLSGSAVIQNLIEKVYADQTDALVEIASLQNNTGSSNNSLFFNNTIMGSRTNVYYDESASYNKLRMYNFDYNNYMDVNCLKTDVFLSTGGGNNARTGNWPDLNSVGGRGNLFPEINGISAAGSFVRDFIGLYGYQNPVSNQTTSSYPQFVSRQSGMGSFGAGAGFGDYHYQVTSPCLTMALNAAWVLPYDIDGYPRFPGTSNTLGCYAFNSSIFGNSNFCLV